MKLYHLHKDSGASVTYGGKTFTANDAGEIDVPEADSAHFAPHGFHTTPPDFTKPPVGTISIEAHAAVGDELTMYKQDNAELRGKIEALEAEIAKGKKK